MKKILPSMLASGLILLAGCSIIPQGRGPSIEAITTPRGTELVGQSLRVEAGGGRVSTMRFNGDGTVQAAFGNQQVNGAWTVASSRLCFSWAGTNRECWPYTTSFVRGETVTLTSDRGNVVRVTLQ
jgi:hypothetical protein